MSDYEGQEYEDTEAQAEAYYAELEGQEYIDREYEYWEALEGNDMLAMAEDEAAAINKELNILDLQRMARENGEKPAREWGREDFKDLLRSNSKLRHLSTRELRALFLHGEDVVDGVEYYQRVVHHNLYSTNLAVPPTVRRGMQEGNHYAFQRWEAEDKKLWDIWTQLVVRS